MDQLVFPELDLTREQWEILNHTMTRAARGLFCGDSPAMQELVAAGLMESAGKVSWCPDEFFRATPEGKATHAKGVNVAKTNPPKPLTKRQRQRRDNYSRFLVEADVTPDLTFKEWIKEHKPRN